VLTVFRYCSDQCRPPVISTTDEKRSSDLTVNGENTGTAALVRGCGGLVEKHPLRALHLLSILHGRWSLEHDAWLIHWTCHRLPVLCDLIINSLNNEWQSFDHYVERHRWSPLPKRLQVHKTTGYGGDWVPKMVVPPASLSLSALPALGRVPSLGNCG
jgi:hypothetical protein